MFLVTGTQLLQDVFSTIVAQEQKRGWEWNKRLPCNFHHASPNALLLSLKTERELKGKAERHYRWDVLWCGSEYPEKTVSASLQKNSTSMLNTILTAKSTPTKTTQTRLRFVALKMSLACRPCVAQIDFQLISQSARNCQTLMTHNMARSHLTPGRKPWKRWQRTEQNNHKKQIMQRLLNQPGSKSKSRSKKIIIAICVKEVQEHLGDYIQSAGVERLHLQLDITIGPRRCSGEQVRKKKC